MPQQDRAVVVVPTRDARRVPDFLASWAGELAGAAVVVVDTGEPHGPRGWLDRPGVTHLCAADLADELAAAAWIMERGSESAFGVLAALARRPDWIAVIADDRRPDGSRPLLPWQRPPDPRLGIAVDPRPADRGPMPGYAVLRPALAPLWFVPANGVGWRWSHGLAAAACSRLGYDLAGGRGAGGDELAALVLGTELPPLARAADCWDEVAARLPAAPSSALARAALACRAWHRLLAPAAATALTVKSA